MSRFPHRRRLAIVPLGGLLLGLAPALLAGCRGEAPPEGSAAPQARRIIALTPSVAETLFALGLGDRVVGVSDYSTWPPEVKSKPSLGGLFNPNLEKIVALDPDLAILIPSEHDLGEKLRGLGVDTMTVSNESLEDVETSIHDIARRCGVPEAGERLAAEWKQALAPRPLPPGATPDGRRPRVLISVGRPAGRLTDMLIAGPGTFLDELLTRLGAENAFADAKTKWPQIPLEEVVARAPDVILEVRIEELPPATVEELKRDWDRLPGLPAVAGGRIEVIAGDYTVIPGPRLPRLYEDMAAALAKHVGRGSTVETPRGASPRREDPEINPDRSAGSPPAPAGPSAGFSGPVLPLRRRPTGRLYIGGGAVTLAAAISTFRVLEETGEAA